MGREVAEQVQSMAREAVGARTGLDRAAGQAPRLVELGEKQTGAPERMVGPAAMEDDSSRRLTLEELFTLPQPVQRLARLAELRQCPGAGGNPRGKQDDDVSGSEHCDAVLHH